MILLPRTAAGGRGPGRSRFHSRGYSMHRIVLWIMITAILASLGACGRSRREQVAAGQGTTSIGACSVTPGWEGRGERVRLEKKQQAGQPQARAAGNIGDFAYRSQPQDISGPGTYTLTFGPVLPDFNFPSSPSALTYDFPPDFAGQIGPALSEPHMVSRSDGTRYLEVSFEVRGNVPPCSGLVAWVY